MLYEVKLRSPVRGRYPQHAWLDALLKTPLEDSVRDFTWRAEDGYLYVRSINPRPGHWRPVIIPVPGTPIRFALDAHVRCNNPDARSRNRNYAKLDTKANIIWLYRQTKAMGLDIEQSTFISRSELIDKPDKPFLMHIASFNGTATVIDQQAFEAKLITGIGNAKAFGLGFLHFQSLTAHPGDDHGTSNPKTGRSSESEHGASKISGHRD